MYQGATYARERIPGSLATFSVSRFRCGAETHALIYIAHQAAGTPTGLRLRASGLGGSPDVEPTSLLASACGACGRSAASNPYARPLSKAFKGTFGQSPGEYRRERLARPIRLAEAAPGALIRAVEHGAGYPPAQALTDVLVRYYPGK